MNLTGRLFKEGPSWVGYCPELDLATHGESPEDSRRVLRNAIVAFLEACLDRGNLDEVLKERGNRTVRVEKVGVRGRELPVYLNFLQEEQFAVRVGG